MKLTLRREPSDGKRTFGKLFINEYYECETLEDPVRDIKLYGRTAIPAGTYRVIISYSPRFQRDLPLLLDVPGFSGIRIHPGNTEEDTLGCILTGTQRTPTAITGSRVAFNKLFEEIEGARNAGEEVEIEIING